MRIGNIVAQFGGVFENGLFIFFSKCAGEPAHHDLYSPGDNSVGLQGICRKFTNGQFIIMGNFGKRVKTIVVDIQVMICPLTGNPISSFIRIHRVFC